MVKNKDLWIIANTPLRFMSSLGEICVVCGEFILDSKCYVKVDKNNTKIIPKDCMHISCMKQVGEFKNSISECVPNSWKCHLCDSPSQANYKELCCDNLAKR